MAQAAPEAWCTKEGLGGAGRLGGLIDGAKFWSARYARISGRSLLFFKHPDDEEAAKSSILNVEGCALLRGAHTPGMIAAAFSTEEYKIELTRPDLRGDDHTTRFCFKEAATRDRMADALENMCAGREWNVPAEDRSWTGMATPTLTPPRIAQTFALVRDAEGFGMKLNEEGVVTSITPGGPAEPAAVPVGGKIVQVNGAPVRSLKSIQTQLKACGAQQPVKFFVLLPAEDSHTVQLLFDILDLDGDGRLSYAEYAEFLKHTEKIVLDAARWGADTRALGCGLEGPDFAAFVRLFADTRFRHYGQAIRDKDRLLWQPVTLKWMYEDGALTDSAWARRAARWDPLSRHWTQGDASQTVASLVAAERGRTLLVRVLMSQGVQRGRLLDQTGMFSSASKWFVLREGVHVGAYDLCVFSSEDSEGEPDECIQLTTNTCATPGSLGEFTVWGYGRSWTKSTWSLKAESVEDQQAWLAAINGLQFGPRLVRTMSNSIPQTDAEAALVWVEEQYQGEQLRRLLQAIDSNMQSDSFELAGGLLRALLDVVAACPQLTRIKEQYEAKARIVQSPLMSLLQEANALLDEEYTRPSDACSRDTCISVRKLGDKLNSLRAIEQALGGSLDGDARAAQKSTRHDLTAKIQGHLLQLLMEAARPDTNTPAKVSLLERAEHVAGLHPQHFPEGSSDPSERIDAVWNQLSASVVALYEECLRLTDEAFTPAGDLTRSQSSRVEDGVVLLARNMALLDEYRTAFSPPLPTAEEGVPQPEPEPEGLPAEPVQASPPVSKSMQLHEQVVAQMSHLTDRLSAVGVQLNQPVDLTTQEGCDYFARSVETLSFYAKSVDQYAAGGFAKTHGSQMEHAKSAVEHLFRQFDGAEAAGDPAAVDTIIETLEQIEASVPSLKKVVNQKMPELRRRVENQIDKLESKATQLYQAGNFVGLSQFLQELQNSPSQVAQFGQVQAQLAKKLERAHDLGLKCLEQNATTDTVDILAECMRTLNNARVLEDVIDCGGWRTGLLARIQDVCSNLAHEAIGDAEGWQLVRAQNRIVSMELYTRCPDSVQLREQIDQARSALSRQLDSVPEALEAAIGETDAGPPAPNTVDKIIKALKDASEKIGGRYTNKLDMCTEVITEQARRLKQQWDTALVETDAQQASASCQLCKQLVASSAVAAEFATQNIELAVFDRKLQEVKQRLFSASHLQDSSAQHTLSARLEGLRAVDEAAFVQMLANFASDVKRQAEIVKGRMLSEQVSESSFAEMAAKANDFEHFAKVLRPHCVEFPEQFDQITAARADLVESWVQCTKLLCDKLQAPGAKEKIEVALRCIEECRLAGEEQAQVDDVRRHFDDATRTQSEIAEKLARDFQTLMRMDCREPTTFTMRGPNIAAMLLGLHQNEALIPATSRDSISYENAVGHLQRAIRDIEDPCIEAVHEQNYRRCAQMSDCLNRLARVDTGEIDDAAKDVLERVGDAVRTQLQELCQHAQDCFREGLDSDAEAASQLFQEVNGDLEKLKTAGRTLRDARCFDNIIRECSSDILIAEMKQHIAEAAKETVAQIRQMDGSVDPGWVADELLTLYQVPSDIAAKEVKSQATKEMEKVLAAARKYDAAFSFTDLANALSRLSGGRGGEIVDLLPAFKKWKLQKFQQSTAGATPEWSLQELAKLNNLSAQQKATLERHYAKYFTKYNEMLEKHFATRAVPEMVAAALGSSDVVEIIAGICAVWSLAGSSADDDDSSSIIRPHAVQVLSIFVLLGLDTGKDLSVSGHLIQVKTGQGKSVLLGVLATLLAVRGWDVDCVCYSSYLSARDEESFRKVFEAFNVHAQVQYGTFNSLAENSINAQGDVRKLTEEVVVNRGAPTALPVAAGRRRILLIDEVDVFFSDTFFGEVYRPQTKLKTESTDELQHFLWNKWEDSRQNVSNLVALGLKSSQYSALVAEYPHLQRFLEAQVRQMAHWFAQVHQGTLQVPNFRVMQNKVDDEEDTESSSPSALEPEPEPADGTIHSEPEPEPEPDDRDALCRSSTEALWKIGYEDKAQGTFDTRMFYGYETVGLYFQEQQSFDEGEADHGPMDLDYALGFQIPCGAFSFAEMGRAGPGATYECILGVSGTLTCLGEYEKRIIRDTYQIAKLSIAPSIYGDNRMQWDSSRDVKVQADMEQFYREIQLDVAKKKKVVSCLVFFENESRMKGYEEYLERNQILTSNQFLVAGEVDKSDLDHYVQRAARKGNCTLFTKIHGRGLDFVCHDDQVDSNGGIHVVQTFLSEEESEEIQIRGRSARQDKNGTFKMILLRDDLEKFGASDADRYDVLDQKRRDFTNRRVEEREGQVKQAAERHQRSMEYAENLRRGAAGFDRALAFLDAQFHKPAAPKSVLFVLDYSASMIGPRSTGCLNAVGEVFENHVNGKDHVGLMLFNHEVRTVLPWTQKAGNEAQIQAAIAACNSPNNRTKLWGALDQAIRQAGSTESDYWIVLLTDGDDTNSFEPARKGDNAEDYDRGANTFCNQRLLPSLKECTEQDRLAGLIAITAGNEVSEATKSMLREMTTATGMSEGMIDCENPELLKEAFGRAAEIMNNAAGRM